MRTQKLAALLVVAVSASVAIWLCYMLASDAVMKTNYLLPQGIWPTNTPDHVARAKELVQPNDTREVVIQKLSGAAWYHAECPGWDLFFYGSRKKALVNIVAVGYDTDSSEAKVVGVYSLDSDHLRFWDICVSESIFDE